MIEASKVVTIEGRESVSDSISAIGNWGASIDVACRQCKHYFDDLYHTVHHDNYICSYWGCGQVLFTQFISVYVGLTQARPNNPAIQTLETNPALN